MRRVIFSALAVVVSGFMALVPAGPAGAVTSGAITLLAQGGFVGPDACQSGPPRFQLRVDEWLVPDYDDWSADITITGPNGYYDTDFLWDDEGWNEVFFCDSPNVAGTYRITAEVEINHDSYYDYYSTYHTISETFQVTGPVASTVSFVRSKYRAHGWKFNVRATRAGRPWRYKTVVLQGKCYGSWQKVHAKKTNYYGRVTFTAEPEPGANSRRVCGVRMDRLPFRFYVAGNWNTRADASTTFRIWRR